MFKCVERVSPYNDWRIRTCWLLSPDEFFESIDFRKSIDYYFSV